MASISSIERPGVLPDLVVPAGTTLILAPAVVEAQRFRTTIQLARPIDLVTHGLIGSHENLKRLIAAARESTAALLRHQKEGLAPFEPADGGCRPDTRALGRFLACAADVPLGEAQLFWRFIWKLPPTYVNRLAPDVPWDERDMERFDRALYIMRSMMIEGTVIATEPLLEVRGGQLYIGVNGRLVLASTLDMLYIIATDIRGESSMTVGEISDWIPNIDGAGRDGVEIAPEQLLPKDGATGARGTDGNDAVCHPWWEFWSSDQKPTVGGRGHMGGAPEDGWDGYDGTPGKTVLIRIEGYLGGITVNCRGGKGQDGATGARGGDGGPGGDGGNGMTCQPNARGGDGGDGYKGGAGGVGGRGGDGGSVYFFYRSNTSGEVPHLLVEGGSAGSDGTDGEGGRGGKPGCPGRKNGLDSPDDIGPVPKPGKDGEVGFHIIRPPQPGANGQAIFEQTI